MNAGRHPGEVALVTGANKGLGREFARRLAAEGMVVYLGARDQKRGRAAAEVAAARVEAESGRLDVLVNNAGILLELALLGADGPTGGFFTRGEDGTRETGGSASKTSWPTHRRLESPPAATRMRP